MNSKTFCKVQFSEGPGIGVHFCPHEDNFKVLLVLSPRFYASFFTEVDNNLRDKLLTWLEGYGKKLWVPADFLPRQKNPPFTEKVLETLKKVPFGEVVSYSKLAALAGSDRASRAVGTICKLNPYPLFFPCHRVISKGGSLGGFAFGTPLKTTLLEFEETTW
ncbi:MAG: MGMT family protein [Verrucomicrobia bacterium]|nr:MGMT family protein [Verrucomicrobiota bacterium]